ncbi:MAG: hypothetical protein SCM11_21080 [Bacillota bacterium]|nr:hypothetical protein [Bacillota bacterium]
MELPLLYHDLTHSRKPSAVKVPAYLADLQLDTLLQAMAGNDPVIYSLCLEIMIHPLTDTKEIYLRQAVLQDAIRISSSFRFIYARALHAIEQAAEHRMGRDPIHDRGLSVTKRLILESETGLILLDALQQIRQHLIEINDSIHSARLSSYVNEQLQQFLPTFFTSTKTHLEQMVSLKDTGGIVIHCKVGQGLKLDSVMLCQILDGPENPEVSKTTHVRRHLFKRKSKDNNLNFPHIIPCVTKGTCS